MNKIAAAVLLQVLPLLVSATSSQNIDPEDIAIIDGREYYFSPLDGTIPEAIALCTDTNMALASFETQDEFNTVIAYIENNLGSGIAFWTSGTRQATTWMWSSVGREITYFKWEIGEPDVTDTTTQSNLYILNGLMNDNTPTSNYKFICEQL